MFVYHFLHILRLRAVKLRSTFFWYLVPDILKPPHCLETLRTNHPVIQCYNPEEWKLKE